MTFLEILILSFVEGLTEFIPVSSTGHLILASQLMNLSTSDLQKAFDVIIQFGAIMAVVFLYRENFKWNFSFYKKLLIAFIPAGVIGFLLKDFVNSMMSSTIIVAWALIIGGILMIIIDRNFAKGTTFELSEKLSFKIGLFQCLALIPGFSRSGATIMGAQILGVTREKAAEFSFLLAVPTITAAALYKLWKIRHFIHSNQALDLMLGICLSFIFALLAIKFFIGIVKKYGFVWFGIYRILIGFCVLFFMN